MSGIAAFIEGLPKAELHVHIEGTIEPGMMLELGRRNGVRLHHDSAETIREAYRFSRLQDFLDLYYQGMAVLCTERDFYELTLAYLERARAQTVLHAEIFFDPQGHVSRGVLFETVLDGITRALEEGERRLGISSQLILCLLRHLDANDAMATLERALQHRDRIVGVGLDSTEVGNPPSKFKAVFARARDAGFRVVAHAGEEGPSEYVWEALDQLHVERVDHGNRALEDERLVARLAADRVPLTVCPLSNLRLGVVRDLRAHPLKSMLERGLLVTVNSDDPAYFGGYVNENYAAVQRALGLSREEIVELARNSFRASFLDEPTRARHLESLEQYLAASS